MSKPKPHSGSGDASAGGPASPSPTFAFVALLAKELSGGSFELPGFPEVVLRVRRVLSDENVKTDNLVRVISSEPSLASRLLQIANSAAYNAGANPVNDLRTAVSRLGHNVIRTASVAFAMAQLRRAEDLRGLESRLNELWQQSTLVASLCCVIARRSRSVNPDEALLAGLLHGVGKLYILTRARKFPDLLAASEQYLSIVQDWHANIAGAVLETWKMPQAIVDAVKAQDELLRERRGAADLTDILIVSCRLGLGQDAGEELERNLDGISSTGRVMTFTGPYRQLVEESMAELEATRAALGA